MTQTQGVPAIRLIGYCSLDEHQLAARFLSHGTAGLTGLDGEYTLVINSENDCWILTSPVGAMHYFYRHSGGDFHHGERLTTILRNSGLAWRWNWQALGDLIHLENLTGNATLHPEIHRVPPGSRLHFHRPSGRLQIDTTVCLDEIRRRRSTASEAVDALNREVLTWAGDAPFLSLSGGFDSRVILSAMLRQGVRPHLITVGNEQCSDVRVARSIAERFGLHHGLIRLELADLLLQAPRISDLTNGTKTAWHWHTFLYPLKAAIPAEQAFFVGTLGEFARSYYFDRGALGLLADGFPNLALRRFWTLKLGRHATFREDELHALAPELARELDGGGIRRRARRLADLCHHRFLDGLTRYYFEQRVPNFYANGIAMYRASSNWRSPFHSRRWIEAIWNLPQRWKLGSNWHRFALARNCPELLEFPEENGFDRHRMLPKAPPLYWTPWMRRTPYVSYDLSGEWFRHPDLQEHLREQIGLLDGLVDRKLVLAILEEHRARGNRTRSLAHLLTMSQWLRTVGA